MTLLVDEVVVVEVEPVLEVTVAVVVAAVVVVVGPVGGRVGPLVGSAVGFEVGLLTGGVVVAEVVDVVDVFGVPQSHIGGDSRHGQNS